MVRCQCCGMRVPTFTDVLDARDRITPVLPPTPMWHSTALSAATGAEIFVKYENTQPIGAFKVRGGLNLLATMPERERAAGVLGYSTGNHAQSLAYAARHFDVPCTIVMPENANPTKAAAVRALGAELVEFGATFDESSARAHELVAERGMRLVSAANEPRLVAGVATAYLELVRTQPDLDAIVVPVGGGSGAAAACIVTARLAPRCEFIAVQSAASPAAHDSWRAGEVVERPNTTAAEGLATGSGFELTQRILRDRLTDFMLVDDADIAAAQWSMLRDAHTLAEGAGAAALAAVLAQRDRFAGKRVAIVCTGANASQAELRRIIPRG